MRPDFEEHPAPGAGLRSQVRVGSLRGVSRFLLMLGCRRSRTNETKLDPEIECVNLGFDGAVGLYHPLLPAGTVLAPGEEERANALLQRQRERLKELEENANFEEAVRLHNPDFWTRALRRYAAALPPETYWPLVRWCYCEHQFSFAFKEDWLALLRDPRPRREGMMSDDERLARTNLAGSVEIMRGFAHDGAEHGFSWTTSLEVAARFAQEAVVPDSGPPRVAYGVARREDVIAVLLEKGEREILALPEHVDVKTLVPVRVKSDPPHAV